MTWILTATGREHDLANPPTSGYSLGEIAHALAHINRYTGHTIRPYSVAEHSLLCADMAHNGGWGAEVELCCLLHDAHEAYCGDMPSPIKPLLGRAWANFEAAQARAVLTALGVLDAMTQHAELVRKFDLVALATERRDIVPYRAGEHAPWPVLDTPGCEVQPWVSAALMAPSCITRRPREWAARFEKRAKLLLTECDL